MKKITDKQRMDFIERQGFTRWVGHGTQWNNTTWPVFEGDSFRRNVDIAIESAQHAQRRSKQHGEQP